MQVLNAPFGANATRVSATDRDTLVSTTGATWYSPDGQPVARPKTGIGKALEMAVRGKNSRFGQTELPIGKLSEAPLPLNEAAVRDAFIMARYQQEAEATSKRFVGTWAVLGLPKFVDTDARGGAVRGPGSEFCSVDFDGAFRRNCRKFGIELGATIPGPVLHVPRVMSRNERRLARLERRELEYRNAVAKQLPVFEIDDSPLDIIILDHTRKERVR